MEKGFWDVELAVDKHVAKLRSELGEVIQADRNGIMYEVKREGAKPEGVAAELADFVMMMLDWMQHSHPRAVEVIDPDDITEKLHTIIKDAHPVILVNTLYAAVEDICAGLNTDADTFYSAMVFTVYAPEIWLRARGYDLWKIIRLKMEYNKSRPKLHGRLH